VVKFRVVVVEDYEPFRRFVCSTLRQRPELQIVGEASDGLEAVVKVRELQPDLVLMDVGLPALSGIEAARRIREIFPTSRIVFVSQESAAEVLQEAFRLGALGYVSKMHTGIDLLAAVDAACQGRHFISECLSGLVTPELAGKKPAFRFSEDEVFSETPDAAD